MTTSIRGTRKTSARGSPIPTRHAPDLAWYVRSQSLDGQELIDFYFAVLRGDEAVLGQKPSLELRVQVADRLTDRGYGKAPQHIEVTHDDTNEIRSWSLEDLHRAMKALDALEADCRVIGAP